MTALAHHRPGSVRIGLGATLASAIFLSGLGITTQLAFEAGVSVGTLLSGRFLVASVILWLLVALLRAQPPTARQTTAGLALGVGYSAHAWLFSASLARLDAGLVDLLLFTYPALVTVGAVASRRDHWSRQRAIALAAATAGTSLVLVGGLHSIDPLGAVLAVAAAIAYAAYTLVSAGQLERTNPLVLTALVTTGAAITLTPGGVALGAVTIDIGAAALLLVVAVGVIAAAGMSAFVAGISRLGPARASIVSAVQPALTPVLGFIVFADRLGPAQVLGGVLVVGGVVVLESNGVATRVSSFVRLRRDGIALRRSIRAFEVRAGTQLVTQGAYSDAFFMIDDGNAAVIRDGRQVAELGPSEFFGEIGLLQRRNRTASVVATSDMRVRVVHRHEFEAVLRRLPEMAHAVRRANAQRLQTATPRQALTW